MPVSSAYSAIRIPNSAFLKPLSVFADKLGMVGRVIPCLAGALLLAGAVVVVSAAQDQDDDAPDTAGSFPKLALIREKAEAGAAKSQTKLGDYYFSVSDFTNATAWYRKAADQGEVEAQLSLASCYMTGRGVEKNPQHAARLLRAAATQIGGPQTNGVLPTVAGMDPRATLPSAAKETASVVRAEEERDAPVPRVQRIATVQAGPWDIEEGPALKILAPER